MISFMVVCLILSVCMWGLVFIYDPDEEEKRQAIEDELFKKRVAKAISLLKKEKLL